jgi:hypothetical protein
MERCSGECIREAKQGITPRSGESCGESSTEPQFQVMFVLDGEAAQSTRLVGLAHDTHKLAAVMVMEDGDTGVKIAQPASLFEAEPEIPILGCQ